MIKTDVKVNINFDAMAQDVADALFKSMAFEVADNIYKDLKTKNRYFKDKTGTLRNSIQFIKFADGFRYIIRSKCPYAWYVEKGHASFVSGEGKVLKHTRGRNFMRRAKNKAKRNLKSVIDDYSMFFSKERGVYIKKQKKAA